MAMSNVPGELKCIQPFMKIADEHDKRDPVISYWCRLYAVHTGLQVGSKSKESSSFLLSVMEWLEKAKRTLGDNEAVTNEVVAQAHVENYALKLFMWADGEDRAGRFNKNVVKAFYTAGFIYDVVSTFGEMSEEVAHHKKYAKWKATYIHNCLKSGLDPVPGPIAMEGEEGEENNETEEYKETPNYNFESGGNFSMPQAPYPSGSAFDGSAFGMPSSHPMTLVPPVPGAHAPPSTPNGSSQPSPAASGITYVPPETENGVTLRPEDFHQAQKYCKWAGSALQYEDVPTAIENLEKALVLLTTGKCE